MTPPSTRERLLQATCDLLAREGPDAVTTGALCASIGLTQSSFYRHFRSIDACMGEALGALVAGARAEIRADRHRTGLRIAEGEEPLAATAAHYRRVLDIARRSPALAPLLVRHRYDRSPTAAILLALDVGMRDDLTEDIVASGASAEAARIAAEILVGAFQGALAGLIDGRICDPDAVAWALAGLSARSLAHLTEFPAGPPPV